MTCRLVQMETKATQAEDRASKLAAASAKTRYIYAESHMHGDQNGSAGTDAADTLSEAPKRYIGLHFRSAQFEPSMLILV